MLFMKKTLRIILFLILALNSLMFSAISLNEKTYVYATSASESVRWVEDCEDGILISGLSNSDSGNGNNDIFLMKVNYNGEVLWKKFYGGSDDDRGYVVRKVDDGIILGGVILTKKVYGLKNNGAWDVLVLKLDNNGEVIWSRNYGKNMGESIRDIIPTYDGGYMFCGYTFSDEYENFHGGKDFWVVKIDHDGAVQWEKIYGGSNYDMAYSLVETRDDNYVVAGYSFSYDGDLKGMGNHGNGDFWVMKLDYYGNMIWSKLYGGSSWEEVRQVIETKDRGFILAGVGSSKDGDIEDNKGHWDAWVVKLNREGDLEWEKSYGGTSYDKVFSVCELRDRGLILTGMTKSEDVDVGKNYGGSDVWLLRLSRYGDLIWEKTIGDKNSENAENVIKLSDGRYAVSWGEFKGKEEFAGDNGRRYKNIILTMFQVY